MAWDKKREALYRVAGFSEAIGRASLYSDIEGKFWDVALEDIDLYQFTGLLDKDSKEIYEGGLYEWDEEGVFEVKWGYMKYTAFCITRKRPKPRMKGDTKYSEDLLSPFLAHRLKYIGHIACNDKEEEDDTATS